MEQAAVINEPACPGPAKPRISDAMWAAEPLTAKQGCQPRCYPLVLHCSAPTATSPLGRAEWLRYVSLFFNREWEAETLVRFIRNDYNSLKRAAQATAAAQGSKPVVAWIYKGFSADFVVTKAPYKVAYVEVWLYVDF